MAILYPFENHQVEVCGGDTKLQIQNSSSTRVYPISPGVGERGYSLKDIEPVFVCSAINAIFVSSTPNYITPIQ